MTLHSLAAALSFATIAFSAGLETKYSIKVEDKPPSSAIEVPGDFFGFGFETAFLPHFDNEFSENMVDSIGDRMGKPLIIRIGGTSGDLVQVDPDQKEAADCIAGKGCPHSSEATFSLGKTYFDGFKRFTKAHMTIQAPLRPKLSLDSKNWTGASLDYVRRAYTALGKERVAAIALGNEPDYYDYDEEKYIARAQQLEDAIIKELKLEGDDRRIFQLGEIPDGVIEETRGYKYDLVSVLKNKLNKNGFGKFAAQHYYEVPSKQDVPGHEGVQNLLMNHRAIADRFIPIDTAIKYIQENEKSLDFVISETGSIIGGEPIVKSGGFGAALWAVDFHLTAMTRGVKRISNTQRPEATHAYWVPDNSGKENSPGPSVHGIFPSAAFIADFVGKGDGKAVEIQVPGSPPYFSAYAMYASGKLRRVALVNLKQWYPDSKEDRGHAAVTLDVGTSGKATVQRMHADRGSVAMGFDLGGSDDNTTWVGEQWSYKIDHGKGHFSHGKEHEEAKVEKGALEVKVPDSEAIIVSFD